MHQGQQLDNLSTEYDSFAGSPVRADFIPTVVFGSVASRFTSLPVLHSRNAQDEWLSDYQGLAEKADTHVDHCSYRSRDSW